VSIGGRRRSSQSSEAAFYAPGVFLVAPGADLFSEPKWKKQMKKPLAFSIEDAPLAAEPDTPLTLGAALETLERNARQVVALIEVDPARRDTLHRDHAHLSGVVLRIAELLAVLARRKI
jgi:hypothetical protein